MTRTVTEHAFSAVEAMVEVGTGISCSDSFRLPATGIATESRIAEAHQLWHEFGNRKCIRDTTTSVHFERVSAQLGASSPCRIRPSLPSLAVGSHSETRIVATTAEVGESKPAIVGYNECATRFTQYTYDVTTMIEIFHPLLALSHRQRTKSWQGMSSFSKKKTESCGLA